MEGASQVVGGQDVQAVSEQQGRDVGDVLQHTRQRWPRVLRH